MVQFRRFLPLTLCIGLLSGCGRPHPAQPQMPAPLAKVLGPTGAVNAAGESPSWSAEVRPGLIRIGVEGGRTVTSGVAGFSGAERTAVWRGRSADGTALRLVVEARPCRDGDTGMPYSLSARAELAGHALFGCAAAPGGGLGPRR